jgi:anti-sigma factor RsiW
MSEHVLDWLGAYHDGELPDDRRRWVVAHLHTCATCQAELAALADLRLQLRAYPAMPARTPPEQFVAQVRLRLPPRAPVASDRTRVRQAAGLWLPLSVVALWAFAQAGLLVSGLVLSAVSVSPDPLASLLPLPGLDALRFLAGLVQPAGLASWLTLVVLNGGLTLTAAALVWGSLASWWAARETNLVSPGLPAS